MDGYFMVEAKQSRTGQHIASKKINIQKHAHQ